MANKEINHELNQYDVIEGIEFTGLMPKVMEAIGMTTGTSDKSVKWFGFDAKGGDAMEVIDIEEIMNSSEDGGSDGGDQGGEGGDQGGDGGDQGGDDGGDQGGDGGDQGGDDGPTETEAEFDFIYNSDTYDAALGNPALQRYYKDHPEEDCYNTAEDRPCNYNDRLYTGTIDDVEVSGKATWASEAAQMITIGNDQYYAAIFYGFDPQSLELFSDVNLTESVGKTFVITQVAYNEDCPHSWKAVNKDAFPWCAVNLPMPFQGTVKFTYEETNVVERQINSEHGYYIVQIASLFGEEYKIDENEQTTFDDSKLVVTLVTEE